MSLRRYSTLISTALLAACASANPQLDGRWKSGNENEPAIEIELKQGRLSVSGGCNSLFGAARIDKGVLIVEQLASTLMACDQALMQRDRQLSAFLKSRPAIRKQGEQLLLGEGRQQLVLNAQEDLSAYPLKFFYVGAERRRCMGVAPMQCLQVREKKNQPWEHFYGEIEGFKPEPGNAYRVRVREVPVANPPADAPNKRWVLDMIVEQELVSR